MPFGGIADGLCGQIKRGYPSERGQTSHGKPLKTVYHSLTAHLPTRYLPTPPWKTANGDLAINNKQDLHSKGKPFIPHFQITNALS